ncbi:hypothetical protein XBKQ1_1380010 [Xenorhabdus bovienii str. kraussei Quebec]|uniref:Uncharacterized protein n=1 Tax=Xenorhabdus bovienii str. kraussei Quebec TaxID=1398203 RepID=A0A077PD98_XENBV|nr:hypothetical protein XBKQ1_1380010 [Xenorhabdus bovienii str. kraussei Quebec]
MRVLKGLILKSLYMIQPIDKTSLPVTMSYLLIVSIVLYAASKRALSPLKSFGPGETI